MNIHEQKKRQMKLGVMKTACLLLPLLLTSSLAKADGKDNALAGIQRNLFSAIPLLLTANVLVVFPSYGR